MGCLQGRLLHSAETDSRTAFPPPQGLLLLSSRSTLITIEVGVARQAAGYQA